MSKPLLLYIICMTIVFGGFLGLIMSGPPIFPLDTPGKTISRKHYITIVLEKNYNKGDTLVVDITQNTYVKGIY